MISTMHCSSIYSFVPVENSFQVHDRSLKLFHLHIFENKNQQRIIVSIVQTKKMNRFKFDLFLECHHLFVKLGLEVLKALLQVLVDRVDRPRRLLQLACCVRLQTCNLAYTRCQSCASKVFPAGQIVEEVEFTLSSIPFLRNSNL